MYVTRFSCHIHADIERGWSAWGGEGREDLEDLLLEFFPTDPFDLSEAWDRWQDPAWRTWHYRDHSSREEFLLDYAEERGWDVRFDPAMRWWCSVHHDGLSCFRLNAETLEEAIEEAEREYVNQPYVSLACGDQTVGDVRLVHSFSNGWHILECDDVVREDY